MKTRDALLIAGGMLSQQVSMFVVGIVIGRALGADDYGVFSLLRNGSLWLLPVMSLGLELAIQKHLVTEETPGEFLPVYRFLRLVVFGVNILVIGFAYGLAVAISTDRMFAHSLIVAFLAMPFMSDALLASGYLRALSRPVSIAIFNDYLQSSLRLALVLVSAYFGTSLVEILFINAFAAAVTMVTLWMYQSRTDRLRAVVRSTEKATNTVLIRARLILSESIWMAVSVLTYGSLRVADLFALSFFVPPDELGSYAALSGVAVFVRLYPLALAQPLGAQISRHFQNNDFKAIRNAFYINIRQSILIATFVFAGIAAFGIHLNLVFGETFIFDPAVCFLLSFSWFVSSVLTPTGLALSMTNNHRRETYALIAGSILLFSLLMLLVPQFGGVGAALASSIAFCVVNCVRLFLAQRVLGVTLLEISMAGPIVLSLALAYGTAALLAKFWPISFFSVSCACIAYSIVYFSLIKAYLVLEKRRLKV